MCDAYKRQATSGKRQSARDQFKNAIEQQEGFS
jgi:hypothetical protein